MGDQMQPGTVTTIEKLDGAYVVTLSGEIDAYTAPSLRDDLHQLVEHEGALVVVIDLGAVTFMDSSALGAVVGVLRRLRERDGELRIVQPRTAASRIFELTGLDAVLDLYEELPDAISGASA
jgi:anti-sigma B factor antagonist